MFLKPPSDPKCPICKRTFTTAKGVYCHIAKEHKGEMFNTDIEGFCPQSIRHPKENGIINGSTNQETLTKNQEEGNKNQTPEFQGQFDGRFVKWLNSKV